MFSIVICRWKFSRFLTRYTLEWQSDLKGRIYLKKRKRNQGSNCQHLLDHQKSKSSRKTSTSALLTMLTSLTGWITTNCGKFWKRWEYQTTVLASWKTCMQVNKQQLEPDKNNELLQNGESSTSRLYTVMLLT